MKHLFLAFTFCILAGSISAQEKNEYAVLRSYLLSGSRCVMELSSADKIDVVFEGSTAEYGKWARDYDNASPALKWIAENNWEVVQFTPPNNSNTSSYFLLKRKKQ
ncbi:MAG: hypothetical protein M9931_07355 [Chitinophagales bacterium]|nr:hypothetical protein [Chitinophagales bacterium]MCO5280853.1 hypothetical protein [Chitinophagales bacterium]OJV27030.1 MAG: hypothetical protein BGO32_11240 [Bacteroidetes bacterium 37-13]HRN93837.1 hypothetical protein [Chitinophagales bacterium]HRP39583.1 hypothetical protein [Chitinophagales bacterium]